MINCINCNKFIKVEDKIDKTKYYYYCDYCFYNTKKYSKTTCKKKLLLNDSDLSSIKKIYVKGSFVYYNQYDISDLIDNKYGGMEQLNEYKKDKKMCKNLLKKNREKILKEKFKMNNLQVKDYGDCYSYIEYGCPNINTVINNELKNKHLIESRKKKLKSVLDSKYLEYDESLETCYDYINGLTNKSMDSIIKDIELEIFLKTNTNYNKLRKQHNKIRAKELALQYYSNDLPMDIKKENKRKFIVNIN